MGMNNTNGINAMMAHTWQSGDDNNFVRGVIGNYMFLGFGVVKAINGERMTISCGARTYTNVELMVFGVDGWGLKVVPAVNDRVLLLTTQVPVTDLKTFIAPGNMPAYDQSGIKAIPITDIRSAQLITVNANGISVTGDAQITINSSGISIVDNKNKSGNNVNKVVMSSSGVEIDDKNGNKIVMGQSNVTINGKLEIGRAS